MPTATIVVEAPITAGLQHYGLCLIQLHTLFSFTSVQDSDDTFLFLEYFLFISNLDILCTCASAEALCLVLAILKDL